MTYFDSANDASTKNRDQSVGLISATHSGPVFLLNKVLMTTNIFIYYIHLFIYLITGRAACLSTNLLLAKRCRIL